MARASTDDRLAGFLSKVSLALGTAQLAAPRLVNRAAGIRDDPTSRLWQRIVGGRELVSGALVEAERPRPARALWMRVAGDAKDLALLGLAYRDKRADASRLVGAMVNVGGIAALDAYAAVRAGGPPEEKEMEDGAMHVKAAITVRKPREEVSTFWHRHAELHSHVDGAAVRFLDAPRNQGTEVHVELDADVAGGPIGAAVSHLTGDEPTQKVKDDLRRVKQVLETGEVARADPGSPSERTDPGRPS